MNIKDMFGKSNQNPNEADYLEDTSYIVKFEHVEERGWHTYTMQLTGGYGWEYMLSSADYVNSADFLDLQQVEYAMLAGMPSVNITNMFKGGQQKFSECKELENERGILSIAGVSKNAKIPVKIVWFNQTSFIRFITMIDDEIRIKKYAESVIRRNFDTPDSMKMGKPINQQ